MHYWDVLGTSIGPESPASWAVSFCLSKDKDKIHTKEKADEAGTRNSAGSQFTYIQETSKHMGSAFCDSNVEDY